MSELACSSGGSLRKPIVSIVLKREFIALVRYIKIQLETINITTRLWGYDIRICVVYSIKPRSNVYCFKLNFNISNMGYCLPILNEISLNEILIRGMQNNTKGIGFTLTQKG